MDPMGIVWHHYFRNWVIPYDCLLYLGWFQKMVPHEHLVRIPSWPSGNWGCVPPWQTESFHKLRLRCNFYGQVWIWILSPILPTESDLEICNIIGHLQWIYPLKMVDLSIVFCMFTRPGNSGRIWQFPLGARLPGWRQGAMDPWSVCWRKLQMNSSVSPRWNWTPSRYLKPGRLGRGWGWMIADDMPAIVWNTLPAAKNQVQDGSSGLLMISFHVLPSRDVVMTQSCFFWAPCGTLWHVVYRWLTACRDL